MFTLFTNTIAAQETVVVGQILNKVDRTPIPQVNIHFKNSQVAVQSDKDGYFLIKTTENYTILLFSCIGYKTEQIRLKQGQSVGVQVELTEENTLLQEVFVIPGSNPALDLMKKVRLRVKENDITRQKDFKALSTEQNLVLMNKLNQRLVSKRVFEQLQKGNISQTDSAMILPLYMAENKYSLTTDSKKEISHNIFSSAENGEKILEKLVGDLSTELNFYNNTVNVLGKSMVSPLANIGFAYYDYYLADSMATKSGKQYEIHFRTKNAKNLAFNGKLWIDSITYALTGIEAELPVKANINYIYNLRISESYTSNTSNRWIPKSEVMTLNMNYGLLADSLNRRPEIFVKRSASYNLPDSSTFIPGTFAKSNYSQESLDSKLKELNNTPLLRTASWIADIMFTGYIPIGKIDIGLLPQILRTTQIEGTRLSLPFRTNERLWKNISLGGHIGYGFKNETVKYSGLAQFIISGNKRRVLSLNYLNDYRRIDYNYNDVMYRENPLVTSDEDISGTVFSQREAGKMSERKEFSVALSNDWNSDIESSINLRFNTLSGGNEMHLLRNGVQIASALQHQSATVITRFSFGEKKYNDHTQRIYISNGRPIVYGIMEVGKYTLGEKSGQYGKILAKMRQDVKLSLGELYYIAEAGCIIGSVPYPLLEIPQGGDTGGYGIYQFNLMNNLEYATDKYVSFHTDFTFNGLILNNIPLVKNLNLREICSFNIAYGGLRSSHKTLLDYPDYTNPLSKPYMEVGVGLSNILKIITLQSIWRLTDLNHTAICPWALKANFRLSL